MENINLKYSIIETAKELFPCVIIALLALYFYKKKLLREKMAQTKEHFIIPKIELRHGFFSSFHNIKVLSLLCIMLCLNFFFTKREIINFIVNNSSTLQQKFPGQKRRLERKTLGLMNYVSSYWA